MCPCTQGAGNGGQKLDLLATVAASPATYVGGGELFVDGRVGLFVNTSGASGYISPTAFRQALLTQMGYACVGFGVGKSVCSSGATLRADTGDCIDGSPVTIQGARSSSSAPTLPAGRITVRRQSGALLISCTRLPWLCVICGRRAVGLVLCSDQHHDAPVGRLRAAVLALLL